MGTQLVSEGEGSLVALSGRDTGTVNHMPCVMAIKL